jgi:hypothetical protein
MRLTGIGFEVFSFFGNSGGFSNEYCSFIRDRAEIFSFFLKHWLQDNKIHVQSAGRFVLFPVATREEVKEFTVGATCWKGIFVGSPSNFSNLIDEESVFRFIFDIIETLDIKTVEETETEFHNLSEACDMFSRQRFEFDIPLAKKLIKPFNITVSMIAHVDCSAISVRVLAKKSQQTVYEEIISQLNPYPFLLKKSDFRKIEVSESQIWLANDVSTSVAVTALPNIQHGDWTAKLPRLTYYKWMMELNKLAGS